MHYAGLDIHKKTISYCVRQADGSIVQEGALVAERQALDTWIEQLPQPCMAGMEATMFTGWVYDHLVGHGLQTKVAHSAMLKAIAAGKRKNDQVDARKISDVTVRLFSRVPHGWPRDPRSAAGVAISKSPRISGCANEEQSKRPSNGGGDPIQ